MAPSPAPLPDLLAVPPARETAIRSLAGALRSGQRVALSTHINADGDGCGSEVALSHLLAQLGAECRIVNPTPWPEMFRFLLGGPPDPALKASLLVGGEVVRTANPRGPVAAVEWDVSKLIGKEAVFLLEDRSLTGGLAADELVAY